MLDFLRDRLAKKSRNRFEQIFKPYVESLSKATAYAEAAAEYVKNVEDGRISCPAHKRGLDAPRSSVVEIWSDLVIETVARAVKLGAGSLFVLADFRDHTQINLLNTLFTKDWWSSEFDKTSERDALSHGKFDGADLVSVNPFRFKTTGNEIHDSLRCLAQAYFYLGTIGTEVCDRLCDLEALALEGKSIYWEFFNQAKNLQLWWAECEKSFEVHEVPHELMLKRFKRTVLDIFIDDIKLKTKSVAMSAHYGPYYESVFKSLVEKNRQPGDEVRYQRLMRKWELLINAKDPDEFLAQSGD